MGDRARHAGGAAAAQAPKPDPTDDLGPRKTLLAMVVVAGCFAVLWPKLFYPMLVENANRHIQPSPIDKTTGCCDVISDTDITTVKIMTELCGTIGGGGESPTPAGPHAVARCRRAVLETCGIDLEAALRERADLGHSLRQVLEEVRSLNGSLCLKYNFGVSPSGLGVPHRVTARTDGASIRQERPTHLRSELVHPAFRERGRAIPVAEAQKSRPPPRIVDGRPGPVPGLRPTMGGAGHVVPARQQGAGVMGLLMPLYTVGIVIFFTYTVMKLAFKKKPEQYPGAHLYPPVEPDEAFRKEVFEPERGPLPGRESNGKMGDLELDQLRRRLRDTELAMERVVRQMARAPLAASQDETLANGSAFDQQEPSVHVVGMETRASCEDGRRWSRPESAAAAAPPGGHGAHHTPVGSDPPQEIYLEGSLPPQSQLLVADSATETERGSEEDPAIVLAGKMTLSVISLDSTENGSDEEKRTTGSHSSDDFEKIEAEQIEGQIDDIIGRARDAIGPKLDDGKSFLEEIERMNREIREDIEKRRDPTDILEEIRHEFRLEDDLLEALRTDEERVDTPASDIVREFLEKEAEENDKTIEEQSIRSEETEVAPSNDTERVSGEIIDVKEATVLEETSQQTIDDVLKPSEEIVEAKEAKILEELQPKQGKDIPEVTDIQETKTTAEGDGVSSELSRATEDVVEIKEALVLEEQQPNGSEDTSKATEERVDAKEATVLEETSQKITDTVLKAPEETVEATETQILEELQPKQREDIPQVTDIQEAKTTAESDGVSSELSRATEDVVEIKEALVLEEQQPNESEDTSKATEEIVDAKEAVVLQTSDVEEDVATKLNEEINMAVEEVVERKEAQVLEGASPNSSEETNIAVEVANVFEEINTPSEDIHAKTAKTDAPEGGFDLDISDELSRIIGDLTFTQGSSDKKEETKEPTVHPEEIERVKRNLSKSFEDVPAGKEEGSDILKSVLEEIARAEEALRAKVELVDEDAARSSESAGEKLLKAIEESTNFEQAVVVGGGGIGMEKEGVLTMSIEDIPRAIAREEEQSAEEGGEEVIEEVEYEDESEEEEEEIGDIVNRVPTERMNGDDLDQSKYGTTSSATAAEPEYSEEENEDEDEEIEEIIEYVDNTDEEGEEIIEVVNHLNGNARNRHH